MVRRPASLPASKNSAATTQQRELCSSRYYFSMPTPPSITDFASCYLYGLTDNPYRQATDLAEFGRLFERVIGNHGGVGLASTFHPYQLVTPAGVTVWYAAYAQLYAQPNRAELFAAIGDEQARFVVQPPGSFADFHIWPDTRLTSAENPIFSRYVPFVLPFLVRKSEAPLRWDTDFAAASAKGDVSSYLESITAALRFVQPAPAFVLGFDAFDEAQPERMIEQFISCRNMLGG
jgi:hypothetical protein